MHFNLSKYTMQGLFVVSLFLFSMVSNGQAIVREARLPPVSVMITDAAQITGAGVEVMVSVSNVGTTSQSYEIFLFGEQLNVTAFPELVGTGVQASIDAFFDPGAWTGSGIKYSRTTGGDRLNGNIFSAGGNWAARQGATGHRAFQGTLAADQSATHSLFIACELGGRIICKPAVPPTDSPTTDITFFRARATNPERNPNANCTTDGLDPTQINNAGFILCKLEFMYTYGIRVTSSDSRGALIGSVSHRAFALGGGKSRISPSEASYPLAGGRAF